MKPFIIVKRYLQKYRFSDNSYNQTIIKPLAIISFLSAFFIFEFTFGKTTESISEQYEIDSTEENTNEFILLLNGNTIGCLLLINEQYTPKTLNHFTVTKQQVVALLLKAEVTDVLKKLKIIIPGLNVSAIIFPFHYFL